jgi:hypothetical protein
MSSRMHSRTNFWYKAALTASILAGCLGLAGRAGAQVAPAANSGGFKLSAGGTGSGYYVQYGEQKLLGVSAFVDADVKRGFGVEAEGRWLKWHQTNDVHVETYSAGLRYHRSYGKFEPYVKGLIGFGNFNFPFDYAHGRYLTATAGGGLDYRLTHRIYIRAADVEYQDWPQFTYGAMTSVGVSAGIRVGIF